MFAPTDNRSRTIAPLPSSGSSRPLEAVPDPAPLYELSGVQVSEAGDPRQRRSIMPAGTDSRSPRLVLAARAAVAAVCFTGRPAFGPACVDAHRHEPLQNSAPGQQRSRCESSFCAMAVRRWTHEEAVPAGSLSDDHMWWKQRKGVSLGIDGRTRGSATPTPANVADLIPRRRRVTQQILGGSQRSSSMDRILNGVWHDSPLQFHTCHAEDAQAADDDDDIIVRRAHQPVGTQQPRLLLTCPADLHDCLRAWSLCRSPLRGPNRADTLIAGPLRQVSGSASSGPRLSTEHWVPSNVCDHVFTTVLTPRVTRRNNRLRRSISCCRRRPGRRVGID